jgi:hypothetical protein
VPLFESHPANKIRIKAERTKDESEFGEFFNAFKLRCLHMLKSLPKFAFGGYFKIEFYAMITIVL